MDIRLTRNGTTYLLRRDRSGAVTVSGPDTDALTLAVRRSPGGGFLAETPEGWVPAEAARDGDTLWVRVQGRTYRFEVARGGGRKRARGAGNLSSPMPGQVQKVLVEEGDTVEAGQALLVVEAMKMQLEIKAPEAGRVRRLRAREGDQIEAGVPLAEMDPAE
jgi:biotin carboxyl carrier protein